MLREQFLEYISLYSFGKPRLQPINPKTLGRQRRGLQLVEKLIGHSLNNVSDKDQLIFMEKIVEYAQGTRIVTVDIFQRFLWWAITNEHLTCQNLIKGNEPALKGKRTPVSYTRMTEKHVQSFLTKITNTHHKLILYFVYYTGADSSELADFLVEDILDEYIVLRRIKLGSIQLILLPDWLHDELVEYTKDMDNKDRVFGIYPPENLEEQRDFEIHQIYQTATIDAEMLIGTSFRDFRINAIRHFYFHSKDAEATRLFAGVPENKKGWLEELFTDQDQYLTIRAKERNKNGKKNISK